MDKSSTFQPLSSFFLPIHVIQAKPQGFVFNYALAAPLAAAGPRHPGKSLTIYSKDSIL